MYLLQILINKFRKTIQVADNKEITKFIKNKRELHQVKYNND